MENMPKAAHDLLLEVCRAYGLTEVDALAAFWSTHVVRQPDGSLPQISENYLPKKPVCPYVFYREVDTLPAKGLSVAKHTGIPLTVDNEPFPTVFAERLNGRCRVLIFWTPLRLMLQGHTRSADSIQLDSLAGVSELVGVKHKGRGRQGCAIPAERLFAVMQRVGVRETPWSYALLETFAGIGAMVSMVSMVLGKERPFDGCTALHMHRVDGGHQFVAWAGARVMFERTLPRPQQTR